MIGTGALCKLCTTLERELFQKVKIAVMSHPAGAQLDAMEGAHIEGREAAPVVFEWRYLYKAKAVKFPDTHKELQGILQGSSPRGKRGRAI